MKILILGIDGYIGYPLSLHLEKLGHEVWGLDNFIRRSRAKSLTPNREIKYKRFFPDKAGKLPNDLPKMDCIVHLAEQPSAPWSMKSAEQANITQRENVLGTLDLLWSIRDRMPNAHLLKLGSMGEYGTPEVEIQEGFFDSNCPVGAVQKARIVPDDKTLTSFDTEFPAHCPYDGMMFPRKPGSFYHLSKVFDSMNIEFACKTWGLRSTDVMQGIVFGLNYWDDELTRFDYDQYFGTVINRFCAQAIAGIPLTVYGEGGQKRGFLPLSDSIKCLTLAIENPPKRGEYRVFNQFAQIHSILDIASTVYSVSRGMDINVEIELLENPRKELENHSYVSKTDKLEALGYNPVWFFKDEIVKLLEAVKPFKDRIDTSNILPTTRWTS
jgi:UDP-sulfoquinovose synthase